MVDIDLLVKIIDKALKKGAKYADIRYQEKEYELIVYDNGVLREYSFSVIKGVGMSVIVDGYMGFAYTTDISRKGLEKMLEHAFTLAKSSKGRARKIEFADHAIVRDKFRVKFKENPFEVDKEEKIKLVEELNRDSISRREIASAITRLGVERDFRSFLSSEGAHIEIEVMGTGIAHTAVAKYGEHAERIHHSLSSIEGYEFIRRHNWFDFVKEIDDLAIRASQAKTPSPGTYIAVIDNELIGLLLHEAFGHASEGDEVEAGISILHGRVGEKVASDLVTIIDEGLVEGGYPVPYDDEGTIKRRTVLVRNGVLESYLHSRFTALKLGQEPTGNARAQDFASIPLVRQTNLYLAPRDWKVDELFEGISYGIYLRGIGVEGGQVNPATGTFTFKVGPSYIIKNGEPVELVRGVVVSGMILETLKEIDAVANDLKMTTTIFGGCGKGNQMVHVGHGGPHVRIRRIIVGGV